MEIPGLSCRHGLLSDYLLFDFLVSPQQYRANLRSAATSKDVSELASPAVRRSSRKTVAKTVTVAPSPDVEPVDSPQPESPKKGRGKPRTKQPSGPDESLPALPKKRTRKAAPPRMS